MYKFGIRYYDPTTGRWTQRDPVGGSLQETTKTNPYVYADNDPVNMVDPSGACSQLAQIGLLAGIVVGILTLAPLLAGLGPADFIAIYLLITGTNDGLIGAFSLLGGGAALLDCLLS